MPDRETVITRLQIIHTWAEFAREYDLQFLTAKHLEDIAQWADDAIELLKDCDTQLQYRDDHIAMYQAEIRRLEALLKEQEAVAPILIREGRNKNYNDYVCPRCDNEVVYEQNYCSECGVQFLWEGQN